MAALQTKCLVSQQGSLYMDVYDRYAPDVRKRLRDSQFNLCAECLNSFGWQCQGVDGSPDYLRGIELMERAVQELDTQPKPESSQ